MREAGLYTKLKDKQVQCLACEWKCRMSEEKTGICGVRKNVGGKLELAVWGKIAAVNIDPIEKKPLYHFLPGSEIYSVGTRGCNLGCDFCQNFGISQASKGGKKVNFGREVKPEEVVKDCEKNKIRAIAFTYNEPTIWVEYAVEVMKLAKKKGIRGVFVSNGFMSRECLNYVGDYIDAYNIDLKAFTEEYYRVVCHARLKPVLRNIEEIYKRRKGLELTTLLVPGKNDSEEELKKLAKYIASIDKSIPWHISAFWPTYKMADLEPTKTESLRRAYEIGKEAGLKYVYGGNIENAKMSTTFCSKCGSELIKRAGFEVKENKLKGGRCFKCGYEVEGIWE